ncbi:MAG: OB-fold nucleic acid binding domain-containing protein [Candidatus Aenigmatarchaeota archaeon]
MKRISAIALFCSVIGLALIYFAAANLEPASIGIDQINADYVGKTVEIVGTVLSAYKSEDTLFLSISDGSGVINVVIFSNVLNELEASSLAIAKGYKIRVRGIVDEYRSKLEIIPRKISDITVLG